MTWDPRLTLMHAKLSHDLGRVKAWCEYTHPDLSDYTLVAVAKFFETLGVSLEISVAEVTHPFDDDAIVKTAFEALSVLGYFTSTTGAKRTSPGSVVLAAELTAHERLAAVQHFRDLGLNT